MQRFAQNYDICSIILKTGKNQSSEENWGLGVPKLEIGFSKKDTHEILEKLHLVMHTKHLRCCHFLIKELPPHEKTKQNSSIMKIDRPKY